MDTNKAILGKMLVSSDCIYKEAASEGVQDKQ
jgi:hypothetical protein